MTFPTGKYAPSRCILHKAGLVSDLLSMAISGVLYLPCSNYFAVCPLGISDDVCRECQKYVLFYMCTFSKYLKACQLPCTLTKRGSKSQIFVQHPFSGSITHDGEKMFHSFCHCQTKWCMVQTSQQTFF